MTASGISAGPGGWDPPRQPADPADQASRANHPVGRHRCRADRLGLCAAPFNVAVPRPVRDCAVRARRQCPVPDAESDHAGSVHRDPGSDARIAAPPVAPVAQNHRPARPGKHHHAGTAGRAGCAADRHDVAVAGLCAAGYFCDNPARSRARLRGEVFWRQHGLCGRAHDPQPAGPHRPVRHDHHPDGAVPDDRVRVRLRQAGANRLQSSEKPQAGHGLGGAGGARRQLHHGADVADPRDPADLFPGRRNVSAPRGARWRPGQCADVRLQPDSDSAARWRPHRGQPVAQQAGLSICADRAVRFFHRARAAVFPGAEFLGRTDDAVGERRLERAGHAAHAPDPLIR
ncbi:unnamed protein product [Rhizophagus irregularis]|nr:unnamed protein product [Rhizophagus irregularis]